MKVCSIDGCEKKIMARGWCSAHYNRWRKYGDLNRGYRTVEERFWSKVNKSEGCWEWTGATGTDGYGRFNIRRGTRRLIARPHRVSWELANGPIAKGLEIDHRCHNPTCVRPEHLRPATRKQNLENLRGAQARNKSGHRGVTWRPDSSKWQASVQHHGKRYYLGLFASVEDAAKAATKKRNELFTHNDRDHNIDREKVAA